MSHEQLPASGPASLPPRRARRVFLYLGIVVVLAGAFYLEEDWRGQAAWAECERQCSLNGQDLDWGYYIPPPVRDSDNFFKAPHMQKWLSGRGPSELSYRINARLPKLESVLVSEVAILPAQSDAPAPTPTELTERELAALGPRIPSPTGFLTFARPLDEVKPVPLAWHPGKTPSTNDVAAFFFDHLADFKKPALSAGIHVEKAAANSFRVYWDSSSSASNFLSHTDALNPEFEAIRSALRRPHARLPGDYARPYEVKLRNFVAARVLVQTVAHRAQCDFLLGQPDAALREVTFIHDFCHIFPDKPVLLVSAMIDVAINGLYTEIVADGLDRHVWREADLAALEEQLRQIDLLPLLSAALATEPAASCTWLEQTDEQEFAKVVGAGAPWWRNPDVLLFISMPRGWVYQNMTTIARLELAGLQSLDLRNNEVWPRKSAQHGHEIDATLGHFSPFTFVARVAVPNFSRAIQTTARNQTLANQARVACALERFRLAEGQYPESLGALVPRFIDRIPADLIGGQPLKYRRAPDGQFLLYSIGWNETDDGGDPKNDWVWGASP